MAGAAVQWLRDGLRAGRDASEIAALADSVTDTGGVYLVPAFVGLGAPYWDAYARGTLVGLTRGTGLAEIARAAIDAMAYQVADVVDAMRADAGIPLDVLRVDGGASANDRLCQLQADLLDIPVERPRPARDHGDRRRRAGRPGSRAVAESGGVRRDAGDRSTVRASDGAGSSRTTPSRLAPSGRAFAGLGRARGVRRGVRIAAASRAALAGSRHWLPRTISPLSGPERGPTLRRSNVTAGP